MGINNAQSRKNINTGKMQMKNYRRLGASLLIVVLVISSLGVPAAAERILVFRSMEDPSTPPNKELCDRVMPNKNVLLGASLWSLETRPNDAMVVNDRIHRIGNATACAQIIDFTFSPSSIAPFYIRFDLEDGQYAGLGSCTITSNRVPVRGLILAGCSLNLTDVPPDVTGGAATSLSIFNPFKLTDFGTGSIWTLHVY